MADIHQKRPSAPDTVYVPFSRAALADVAEMARQEGKPIERVIQEALAIQKRAIAARKHGGDLLISENGAIRSLRIP